MRITFVKPYPLIDHVVRAGCTLDAADGFAEKMILRGYAVREGEAKKPSSPVVPVPEEETTPITTETAETGAGSKKQRPKKKKAAEDVSADA